MFHEENHHEVYNLISKMLINFTCREELFLRIKSRLIHIDFEVALVCEIDILISIWGYTGAQKYIPINMGLYNSYIHHYQGVADPTLCS